MTLKDDLIAAKALIDKDAPTSVHRACHAAVRDGMGSPGKRYLAMFNILVEHNNWEVTNLLSNVSTPEHYRAIMELFDRAIEAAP